VLLELKIKNFAIIENLVVPFKKGLNILSGETGAGKSILIDALSGVLGGRLSSSLIRAGSDKLSIEALFDISQNSQVQDLLEESGLDYEDQVLVLKRELQSNGKGRCLANATQVQLSKLKEITENLVDIHGQNEHQSIMKLNKHREILDSFGHNFALLQKNKKIYQELLEIKKEMANLQKDEKEKKRTIEYNSFVVKEIETANLDLGEEEKLKEEALFLTNAEKIFTELKFCHHLFDEEDGIMRKLKQIERKIEGLSSYDQKSLVFLPNIKEALYLLEDASSSLKERFQEIDFSPERINQVEERLSLISSLKKKYGETLSDILAFKEKAEKELDLYSNNEEKLALIQKEYQKNLNLAVSIASELSVKRKKTALDLEKEVRQELSDLGMSGSVFKVDLKQEKDPVNGLEKEGQKYFYSSNGFEQVEFFISPNRGEDLKPLRKIASGGEMSRLMLALKNVLLGRDLVESLVFDEVDAGIGGKAAEIVGNKLKSLAEKRQVMVITHLPQIAAKSDHHLFIEKKEKDNRVSVSVQELTKEEKIKEIARMLAGDKITQVSLVHAKEMISLG